MSYGQPFRWSSARVLAADVKAAICGGGAHNNTPECRALLDVDEWTLDRFLADFVASPLSLLHGDVSTGTPVSTLPGVVDRLALGTNASAIEGLLWDGPDAAWVACSQWNASCYGGIPKDVWHSPARGGACVDAFQAQVEAGSVNSSAAGINICDLDSSLNRMCIDLATARQRVYEANCIYAGACSPQLHVYTPGIYSITNEDFVRGTVTNFYEMYARRATGSAGDRTRLTSFTPGDNTARVCPSEPDELELQLRNTALTRRCAAVQLERAKLALRLTRGIVDTIVKATWYLNSLVLALLRLLLPGITQEMVQETVREVQFWFVSLVGVVGDSIQQGANLVFRIVFDSGGFGSAFKQALLRICEVVNFAMQVWNVTFCQLAREVIAPIVGFLVDILNPVISFFSPGSGEITSLLRDVQASIANMDCSLSLPCYEPRSTPFDEPDGALPVATRCWADYVPGVDDTDALSCTASDTCRASYGPGSGLSTVCALPHRAPGAVAAIGTSTSPIITNAMTNISWENEWQLQTSDIWKHLSTPCERVECSQGRAHGSAKPGRKGHLEWLLAIGAVL